MLAVNATEHQVEFPAIASPKVDGVRGVVRDGKLRSRALKRFPNRFVTARFSRPELSGLDGELVLGPVTAQDACRKTSGAMDSPDGEPDVKFYVFDDCSEPRLRYTDRLQRAIMRTSAEGNFAVAVLPWRWVHNVGQLLQAEKEYLALGYEGVVVRSPNAPYKYGRSTLKEQGMMKLKRFVDGEAVVLGVTEEQKNNNPPKKDKLGHTKRSSHKANKIGKGRLGEFQVRDCATGVEFTVPASAVPHKWREELWEIRGSLPGSLVKYKHFPKGRKDKPRNPVFLSIRYAWDL